MPTFNGFDAFNAELARLGRELEGAEKRRITRAQAERGEAIFKAQASADLGGDPKFSRWKPPLTTQVKTTKINGAVLLPTKTGAGPITVAERGRYGDGGVGRFQGPSLNMRTGRTTRTRDRSVSTRNTRRATVRYSGSTRGFRTASKAVERMERDLPKVAEDGVRRAIQKHFDVT